jgi:hypothetical protein
VLDSDGALWCEKPMLIQVGFLMGKIGEQAAKEPSLRVDDNIPPANIRSTKF